VLNTFAYTGGFTLAALAGGAKSVLSIDSSADALALARENVSRNPSLPSDRAEWREADAFAELRKLRDRGASFDLAILDPPKFAPTASHAERASRAYKDVNLLALKLLRPGGLLATFSCSGGIDAALFLTGRCAGTYSARIRNRIAELSLQDAVIFAGFISKEDLLQAYNAASLLVYPSLYEGYGYPPLEAMACGCPVAASNVTSIPEICGDAALYFDPCDTAAMARAMESILTDASLRERCVAKGFEQVRKFSWETTARQTLAAYQHVYQGTRQ
jgi:glycosyltransferase involved in cell wall biosynthesis